MTTTDHAWARGSDAVITQPPIAPPGPPPIPPTYWPPAPQGGFPGPVGPRRPRRRWLAAAALAITISAAGIGGWALRATTHTEPTPAAPAASPTPPAAALTPEQAKTQACSAYQAAGRRWSTAYHDVWLPAVSAPGWRWSDQSVKDAVAKFSATESQTVSEINGLLAPSTPPAVSEAIRAYSAAILAYSAGHGSASQSDMNDQEAAIDRAAMEADRVCNQS